MIFKVLTDLEHARMGPYLPFAVPLSRHLHMWNKAVCAGPKRVQCSFQLRHWQHRKLHGSVLI